MLSADRILTVPNVDNYYFIQKSFLENVFGLGVVVKAVS